MSASVSYRSDRWTTILYLSGHLIHVKWKSYVNPFCWGLALCPPLYLSALTDEPPSSISLDISYMLSERAMLIPFLRSSPMSASVSYRSDRWTTILYLSGHLIHVKWKSYVNPFCWGLALCPPLYLTALTDEPPSSISLDISYMLSERAMLIPFVEV